MLVTAMAVSGAEAAQQPEPKDLREVIEQSEWKAEQDAWLSPVRKPAMPFDELIYSWQVQVSSKEGFRLYLRVGFGGDDFSPWLYAGYWGEVKPHGKRENPKFDRGTIEMDQLLLTQEAESYQFKIESEGGEPLATMPLLHVIVTDNPPKQEAQAALEYPILDLPLRKQEDSKGVYIADRCQSAALATAMEYYGVSVPLENILPLTYDPEYEYPGIWPRTLGAATQLGFTAYIDRFRDWEHVRKTVAENKVILCSITMPKREGLYTAPPYASIGGHIVALNGITADGRVIVTDSALATNERGYRCQWLQEDFEKIWMENKGGVGMVICPPEGSEMKLISDLARFPRPYEKDRVDQPAQ